MNLTDSNIVLVGGFNPHIIEPRWLMRENVVKEDREQFKVEIQVPTIGSGEPRPIRFDLDQVEWEVGFDRLKLKTRDGSSPAPWIDRLLERLPHIPVRAVGINFRFGCARADWSQVIPSLPAADSLRELIGEQVSTTFISRTKLQDNTQLNLTLTIASDEVVVDANFHRGVNSLETIRDAINTFEQDRDRISQLVKKISHQEVTS